LAEIEDGRIFFKGNILSPDGKEKAGIEKIVTVEESNDFGKLAATELLKNGGAAIADKLRDAEK
jgi:hydroxymethylbilane synthase